MKLGVARQHEWSYSRPTTGPLTRPATAFHIGVRPERFPSAWRLRGLQGQLLRKGGLRVPLLVRWPGRVQLEPSPRSRRISPIGLLRLGRSVARLNLPAEHAIDGNLTVTPELTGDSTPQRSSSDNGEVSPVTRYLCDSGSGDWKANPVENQKEKNRGNGTGTNLATDPKETNTSPEDFIRDRRSLSCNSFKPTGLEPDSQPVTQTFQPP